MALDATKHLQTRAKAYQRPWMGLCTLLVVQKCVQVAGLGSFRNHCAGLQPFGYAGELPLVPQSTKIPTCSCRGDCTGCRGGRKDAKTARGLFLQAAGCPRGTHLVQEGIPVWPSSGVGWMPAARCTSVLEGSPPGAALRLLLGLWQSKPEFFPGYFSRHPSAAAGERWLLLTLLPPKLQTPKCPKPCQWGGQERRSSQIPAGGLLGGFWRVLAGVGGGCTRGGFRAGHPQVGLG